MNKWQSNFRDKTNRQTNCENIFEVCKKKVRKKLKYFVEWTKYGLESLVDIEFEKKIPDTMHDLEFLSCYNNDSLFNF